MLEDFNVEEECSLCRYLADLVCAHVNTAPIQMVNVLHFSSPLTTQVLHTTGHIDPIHILMAGTVTQGAKPPITENCSSTHTHTPTALSLAQLSILPKDIQTCGLEENC